MLKVYNFHRRIFLFFLVPMAGLLSFSCEMPATGFEKIENAVTYTRSQPVNAPAPDSTVRVMTWNIRFGIARGPWFGDACAYKVIYSKEDILKNLEVIAQHINQVNPDILLLEEVDLNATRSAYVDELQWLLDHTQLNYAVYGSQWKAQYIASDGLGRMDEGNVILSRWPMTDAKRIQLDLRKDQSSLVRYFYERCCMVEAKIQIPGFKEFYAVGIHASAFATDDTKHQHLVEFKNELDRISLANMGFVAGGELNTLPPGSDSADYCLEDMCSGESYHHPNDHPYHKDGSNYTPEKEWLVPIYSTYKSAVPLADYQKNQLAYFTHCVRPTHFWDRTLDYLFTNRRWRTGSTITHQDFINDSDHAPVISEYVLEPK